MLQTMFLTVLNMSITASAAILPVLGARLLLRRAPKVFSYALWAVVLFRLLCPVSPSSVISLYNVLETPAAEAGPVGHMAYLPLPSDEENTPVLPAAPAEQAEDAAAPAVAPETEGISLSPLAAAGALWLSGAAALALLNTVRWVKLRRRLLCALPLRENVYLADHIPVPFVMGLVRPRIYLPSDLAEAEQAYIIRHEQHHIRRGDLLFRLLAFAALCIHWFNPLVWLAFTLAGRDMEMSCDEAVLRQSGSQIRADYSLSLLRYSVGKNRFIGAPLAFGVGDTRERIENVMK
ncbi:M56 family metallopeptidase [Intestinimonas sp. HCP28S3_D6]|uniref:M56 family metallopeptidase n=1 Tax=Intestinimonas sp. HCP28S3_D6 TaxID=3438942 RepID=UPI003F8CEB47